jgi:CDP-diacylglycerol--glycerol-3-phosphate 3-phosphatidyltransferase
MLYQFKAKFQTCVRGLSQSGLTANGATAGGWICVALFSACLYGGLAFAPWRWLLLLVPGLAIARLVMNALDGMLARAQGTATAAGELWNEASDIWGDTICYGVLFFVPEGPRLSLTLFLVATWSAEFFGVLGKGLPGGARRHESWGGGKPERAVGISLFALIAYFHPRAVAWLPGWLGCLALLAAGTSLARIRKALALAKGKPYQSYTAYGV